MKKPRISAYIPIYGRTKQTNLFVSNLFEVYRPFAFLEFIVIDCKGDYLPDFSEENLVQYVEVVRSSSSDYWGACINIALAHFIASSSSFFLICNNDTYHFSSLAAGMVRSLCKNGFMLCSIANARYGTSSEVFSAKPSSAGAISRYITSIDPGVYFDSDKLLFSTSSSQIPNVAPTVAIAIAREIILAIGRSLFVPPAIPHYLSDYYFTHELFKAGVSLMPSSEWMVLRFANEPNIVPDKSLFGIKSYSYLPAWICFFVRNVKVANQPKVAAWLFRRILARILFLSRLACKSASHFIRIG